MKRLVTFYLAGGTSVGIEMTPDELRGAMRLIDDGGHIGTYSTTSGKQIWILGRHVTVIDYPSDMASEWGSP